jgi:hypothetical protein
MSSNQGEYPMATIEQRVERLERIVDGMKKGPVSEPGRDDWHTSIGVFSTDPAAQEIISKALELRNEERLQINP